MNNAAIIAANAPGMPFRTGLLPADLPPAGCWTQREERILLATYPAGGARACVRLLPGRSKQAIRQRAYQLRKIGRLA